VALEAGYEGRGKRWAEEDMGIECADRTQAAEKPIAEELARVWAQEELAKEDRRVDWQKFMPPRGYVALPRRWVLERSFSDGFSEQRRMSLWITRGCALAQKRLSTRP
jgi:hypothetical protein